MEKAIIYRGSITDLATDIAYEITPELARELIEELERFIRGNQDKFQNRFAKEYLR